MYTCSCVLTYVGKMTQCLAERIKQHVPSNNQVKPPDLKLHKADSGNTRHLKKNPHCIPQDRTQSEKRFTLLSAARGKPQLEDLEALFIRKIAPPLCSQKEHVKLLSLF